MRQEILSLAIMQEIKKQKSAFTLADDIYRDLGFYRRGIKQFTLQEVVKYLNRLVVESKYREHGMPPQVEYGNDWLNSSELMGMLLELYIKLRCGRESQIRSSTRTRFDENGDFYISQNESTTLVRDPQFNLLCLKAVCTVAMTSPQSSFLLFKFINQMHNACKYKNCDLIDIFFNGETNPWDFANAILPAMLSAAREIDRNIDEESECVTTVISVVIDPIYQVLQREYPMQVSTLGGSHEREFAEF
jgi:hypothetical protein